MHRFPPLQEEIWRDPEGFDQCQDGGALCTVLDLVGGQRTIIMSIVEHDARRFKAA